MAYPKSRQELFENEGAGPKLRADILPLPEIYKVARLYGLDEEEPPVGFLVASGALIVNADILYPLLWAALQDSSNSWRCVTEPQWQALSNVTRNVGGVQVPTWDGVGGVTKFVIDLVAKTIRLPDTRGMYAEGAGFDNLTVGGVHGEGIQNITGQIQNNNLQHSLFWGIPSANGAFSATGSGKFANAGVHPDYYGMSGFTFSSDKVVPTSNQTQPRAYGVLHCVYVGE